MKRYAVLFLVLSVIIHCSSDILWSDFGEVHYKYFATRIKWSRVSFLIIDSVSSARLSVASGCHPSTRQREIA
jgi:hypothetical protein